MYYSYQTTFQPATDKYDSFGTPVNVSSSLINADNNLSSVCIFNHAQSVSGYYISEIPAIVQDVTSLNKESEFLAQFVSSAASSFLKVWISNNMVDQFHTSQCSSSCFLCQQSSLAQLTTQFLSRDTVTPHHLTNPQVSSEFIEQLRNGHFEKNMKSMLEKVLHILSSSFNLLCTEGIQATALFCRILQTHQNCFIFWYLFRKSLETLFVACVVVAHKMNADNCYQLQSFASQLGLPLSVLSQFEGSVLELLDFKCIVTEEEFKFVSSSVLPASHPIMQTDSSDTESITTYTASSTSSSSSPSSISSYSSLSSSSSSESSFNSSTYPCILPSNHIFLHELYRPLESIPDSVS